MTTVERPNRVALNQAIDIYRDAMRPFLVRHLRQVPGRRVEEAIQQALRGNQAAQFEDNMRRGRSVADSIDVNDFPELIRGNWREVFQSAFPRDRVIQNRVNDIREIRNEVSHPEAVDLDEEKTRAHFYMIADVLGRINQPDAKANVEGIRDRLFADPATPQAPQTTEPDPPPSSANGGPGPRQRSASNLTPWRDIIRPNEDVTQGRFQQAEFAADLQQVYDGRASSTEYGNPVSFFNRTYITPGIRSLLVNVVRRLNAVGGDPVIQTRTGFGGGKTHSLIALYHLVNSADVLINPSGGSESRTNDEIRSILADASFNQNPDGLGKVAVLDGQFLAPTDQDVTAEKGDPLNTLWGVMAYQLGRQEAYDVIGTAARQGTAPGGNQLDALFNYVGPCVILVDEPVAYIRNAGNARDSIYTFMQALTQSVRRTKDAALVITLPQSSVEAGAEGGVEAMTRLENILGRIEAVWEPLAVNEAFEVVRRRLFGEIQDTDARDRICQAFSDMYSRYRGEYPQGVAEQNYLQRLKDCYPIHPEVFERLYADWSSIPSFQRTRGVLRMMANCVSRLYLNNDSSPLIMPANLPLSDAALAAEFTRLLDGQWGPVLSEADSDYSRTDNIDQAAPQQFGSVGGAARRLARTIFLGSAPSGAVKGIDDRQIHLGVVQPGQGVNVYNDALARMTGDLYYMYRTDDRYYFHAEENLNKVANDRAGALTSREVDREIVRVLDEEVRRRSSDVIVCPADTTADVPEAESVRLVILPPAHPLPSRSSETDDATAEALRILEHRGDARRVKKNTLLFLAARSDEVRDLRRAVRDYLAWDSMVNGGRRIENLAGERLNQARSSVRAGASRVNTELVRAYRWAMSPSQANPQRAEYGFSHYQSNAADSGEIVQAALSIFIQEEALVDEISPAALATLLGQYVWNKGSYGSHVTVDALWELMTGNVYLPRLSNKTVLLECIQKGVPDGAFGYKESDSADVRFGEPLPLPGQTWEQRAILVNAEVAAEEKARQAATPTEGEPAATPGQGEYTVTPGGQEVPPPRDPARRRTSRVVARKRVLNDISLDDISQLREEIIRNLREDGAEVSVEITITAHKPDGLSESITRSIRENGAQLGVDISEE